MSEPSLFEDQPQPVRPERQRSGRTPRAASPEVPGVTPASAIAISTLTRAARDIVEGAVPPLWVRGEVTDFRAHRNGHWYFCLRDAAALIRCVVWSRDRWRIPAPPDEGLQIVAFGQLSVYPGRGEMQLSILRIAAEGDGLWRKALELTRARLAADGLLDPARRRAIPAHPRRVAVVTSPEGAALRDIVAVIRRRCPSVEIVLVPARVQGDGAAEELAAAVARVSRWREADTVIIGRGGGGREDLWAFNDERVARAVAACAVPTISAVGHEVDITLCDLVADLRAPTPSAAAEAAVPVLEDVQAAVAGLSDALRLAMRARLQSARDRLVRDTRDAARAATRAVERRRARVENVAGRLHALSPLATLGRGFTVARDADGRTLSRTTDFPAGTRFTLMVRDGTVPARAEKRDGVNDA